MHGREGTRCGVMLYAEVHFMVQTGFANMHEKYQISIGKRAMKLACVLRKIMYLDAAGRCPSNPVSNLMYGCKGAQGIYYFSAKLTNRVDPEMKQHTTGSLLQTDSFTMTKFCNDATNDFS